jgi:TolB-like protein/tetratricopeptide (TPR) repeat protein
MVSDTSMPAPVPVPRPSHRILLSALTIAVVVIGLVVGYVLTHRFSDEGPAQKRIAVLPFENMGLPGDEYFAAGMTDEITSRLGTLGGLRVVSHNSAAVFERTGKTTEEIGRALGVGFILEGTIRWDRESATTGRVRITPRLIRVSDDTQMWSKPFDRIIDDIFAVQAEIAEETAHHLGVTLLESEREAMQRRPTENLAAYEAYLRGVAFTGGQGILRGDILSGIQMFERAVGLDSTFALAYSDLSRAHSIFYHYGYDHSPERAEQARSAVERAIEVDPDLPNAHFALGVYYYCVKRDYDHALQELTIAERNLPNSAEAKSVIAGVLRRQGLIEESITKGMEALELNPQDPEHAIDLADSYFVVRRWEEAARYYDISIAIRSDQTAAFTRTAWANWLWKGDTDAARGALEGVPQGQRANSMWQTTWFWQEVFEGRYQQAIEHIRTVPTGEMTPSTKHLLIAQAHDLLNQPAQARAAYELAQADLEPSVAENQQNYWLQASLGLTYAGLGRKADAIQAAKRAVELYPMSLDPIDGPTLVKNLALVHTMLGEHDEAMKLISELLAFQCVGGAEYEDLQPPAVTVPMLQLDPRWEPLKDNPGFLTLVSQ